MPLTLSRIGTLGKFHFPARFFSVTHSRDCFRNINKVIPRNVFKTLTQNSFQKDNGFIYDKKPFKLRLHKDKVYAWCLCGQSKSQPLCDGTHNITELRIKLKPIFFQVEETKEYWLCNCKHTKHRPFCDGSHIQFAEPVVKKPED